jgi:hypothetical protein
MNQIYTKKTNVLTINELQNTSKIVDKRLGNMENLSYI